MAQEKEKQSENNEIYPEISIDLSSKKAHVEITLPATQAKRLLQPLAIVLSHLVTAGLTAGWVNPSLFQHHPVTEAFTTVCKTHH